MEDGWIKLWRKIKYNGIFRSDSLLKCWVYCLIEATHKGYEMMVGGQIVKLAPGQFISGRDKANRELNWKGKKFDRKMNFLATHGFLTREVTNQFTINTIINWDIYQGQFETSDQPYDQRVTSDRPASDQRVTTNKNVKNVKNVKNIYKKKKMLSDEEWIEEIKKLHAWLDWDEVNREMDTWLLNHPMRKKTRQFITNWILNKQKDKPLKAERHHGLREWAKEIKEEENAREG